MSFNLELAAMVEHEFAEHLDKPVERRQDAIVVHLAGGPALTVRYAALDAYSLRWTHDGVEVGIDTAPLHRDLATFPNHFHDAKGGLRADVLTDPTALPDDNVRTLIRSLIENPGLAAQV